MASYKKKKNNLNEEELNNEAQATPEEEDTFDRYSMETVVNRVRGGLVGEYKILDDLSNKPMFKTGDIICFRAPARLQKGDFVLYAVDQEAEQYAIRRIIKFVDDDIYVAGDHESEYHLIHREDVVAKAISRERKNKWLTLTGFSKKKRLYVFKKVKLAKLRLGNRIRTNEEDINSEALEAAMQNVTQQQQAQQEKQKYVITIDLDSDLADFLNPDDLVKEWLAAEEANNPVSEVYVDEDGNPITKEEYEAALAMQDDLEEEEIEEASSDAIESDESEETEENAEELESEDGTEAEEVVEEPEIRHRGFTLKRKKDEPEKEIQVGLDDDDL